MVVVDLYAVEIRLDSISFGGSFVIKALLYYRYHTSYNTIDIGLEPYCAVGFCALTPPRRLYVSGRRGVGLNALFFG